MSIDPQEISDVVNQYIKLIEKRKGVDDQTKEIDRTTNTFLMAVVNDGTQNENIREIKERIDATIESGFTEVDKPN